MNGYTDTIMRYAADDSHVGILENADGIGEVGLGAEERGSRLAVRFTLRNAAGHAETIRYQVFGCGFTIAACAAAAEIAEGLPLEDLSSVDAWAINNRLNGLPEDRSYCAELAAEALQAAVTSARADSGTARSRLSPPTAEHGSRLDPQDPVYLRLLATSGASELQEEDRPLFAGLITVAQQESGPLQNALGLDETTLADLLEFCFPGVEDKQWLTPTEADSDAPEVNPDVLMILLSHVPCDATGGMNRIAEWLARILAARAAQPGHLWVAMGFLERPQLTAAIRRHLPTLAKANNRGMRWKRYLFKKACEMNGGMLCKSPNCDECSDYHFCFAEE